MPRSFDPATEIPDLKDKVVLVTGGNAGLGKATVEALAAHNPKCLYLCCRRRDSGEALVGSIRKENASANITVLDLDLSDLESVKRCAADFKSRSEQLDILILNAGVSATPYQKTQQGYEYQFGVNHLGHALLTQLLMPTLAATRKASPTGDVRIVVVASKAMQIFAPKTGLILDQMKTDGSDTFYLTLYGHSKLANVMFARKLSQLYPDITSTSVHPGTVKSEIWAKASGAGWFVNNILAPLAVWYEGVTIEEGAKNQLWAATAKVGGEGNVENGKFYDPVAKDNPFGKFAGDQAMVDELWQWTNEELEVHGGPGWPAAK